MLLTSLVKLKVDSVSSSVPVIPHAPSCGSSVVHYSPDIKDTGIKKSAASGNRNIPEAPASSHSDRPPAGALGTLDSHSQSYTPAGVKPTAYPIIKRFIYSPMAQFC